MYLTSIYFDDKASKLLQRNINKIAEKTGNTFMTDNNVPPHLTISSVEATSIEELIPGFLSLEGKLTSGTIQFVSIGQLLPYVIYATPVMNQYLLELSDQVYSVYKNIPKTTVSKYYQPFSWLPHVTLGKTLDKKQMRIAFEVLQDNFIPFSAQVTEIGLAKVNPHEDVVKIKLF